MEVRKTQCFTVIGMRTLQIRTEFTKNAESFQQLQLMFEIVAEVLFVADSTQGISHADVMSKLKLKAIEHDLYFDDLTIMYREMRNNTSVEDSEPFQLATAIDESGDTHINPGVKKP